jgi:peroxiredoxin
MALVTSNPFETGTTAPDFTLLNVLNNRQESLSQLNGKNGTVVMFICNHCPFVKHVNEELVRLGNDYINQGMGFIAISSNDIDFYPQDGPEFMKRLAEELHYPFPYLFDETQSVARAYDAACTPDFYIFDSELKSVYHGQLDNSRPGNGIPVTGVDLRNAIDSLLNGDTISEQQPSIGCSIKWK